MATTGQKRSHPDENESSDIEDIDEDALLADDDVDDISKQLNLDSLQLSDEEEDETETGTTPTSSGRGLNLREYQKELAEIAVRGENTIIHAATGAGKTRIAFYVVKKHLENNTEGKVAIMADKTFLVKQHSLALKKIMPELVEKTQCMSGQKEKSDQLHMLMEGYSIFILTPALIENTIKRHDADFLMKFSLLVFDECHHTQKKTSYNRLMTRYHVMKSEGRKPLPQILGLTATLGTNKANSVEKAKEHALKVMANLDVAKISAVTVNTQEYEQFRKDVKSEKIALSDTEEPDNVHHHIEECMRKTEDLFCLSLDDAIFTDQSEEVQVLASTLKKRTLAKRQDPQYITWTSDLSRAAARLLGSHPELARKVTIGASYLKIYSEVLEVNDELTGMFAAKVLDKKLENQHFGSYSTSEDAIEAEYSKLATDLMTDIYNLTKDEQSLEGKKFYKLLTALKDYCNSYKDEARYIVFVKTRDTCEMLAQLLRSQGFKCSSFTGTSATSDVGGTTRAEQDTVVKEFKEGKIHGIIATNILEEGFDISGCNRVFQYNYVGNEISSRQKTGRIRQQEGKQITLSKSKDTLRESLNIQRGILMDEAMKCILSMSEEDIRDILKNEQKKIVVHEKIQRQQGTKVPKLESSTYKMVCRKCGKFEVNCDTLRSIDGHHAVIDPDIWSRISTKPFPKKTPVFDGFTCQSRLFGPGGSGCTHELGVVSTFRDVQLPFISYKFFVVKNTSTSKTTPLTKWADAPFHIPRLEDPDDLLKMQL